MDLEHRAHGRKGGGLSHFSTVERVAKMIGRDEDLIWSLSDQLESEDSRLWIYDLDDGETLAFTDRAIEVLREIIADQIDRAE